MSIMTKITISCKDCPKTFFVEGKDAKRSQIYKDSRKEGWQWKSASIQFCPAHAVKKAVKVAKPTKPAKNAIGRAIAKVTAKKPVASKKAPAKKPVIFGSKPMVNKGEKVVDSPAPFWKPTEPTADGNNALA
jgi:hypothetical protein